MKGFSQNAEIALPWIGIFTAICSAVVKVFASSSEAAEVAWFGLVATSVTSLWGAFILYSKRADEERRRAEAIYRTYPPPPANLRDNFDQWLLVETLRRGSFGGCLVDAALWTAFGKWLLGASITLGSSCADEWQRLPRLK